MILCGVEDFSMLVCIGILAKMRIYKGPTDPIKWYCWVFFCLWIEFITMWVLIYNKYISIYERKQENAPSYVRLVTSLMNFLMLAIWDI